MSAKRDRILTLPLTEEEGAVVRAGRRGTRDPDKPRRYRTDKVCKGKGRYVSEVEALAAGMLSIVERQNTNRLWRYPCRHCDGWHLTSSPQGARWLITADPD